MSKATQMVKPVIMHYAIIYLSPFQAHIHHYTHIDDMEVTDFDESLESLNGLIAEYSNLGKQMNQPADPVPRLKIVA